jgi:Protein of unknown function (DUF3365)
MSQSKKTVSYALIAVSVLTFSGMAVSNSVGGSAADGDEATIAKSLAAMVTAGLDVISKNQDHIDNPNIADKGLDGKTVLAQAQQLYQDATGSDPLKIDPNSRHGRLLGVEMNAIIEVMNAHQKSLNRSGIGFKGFIPSTFGRLVIESFSKGAEADAEIKITAPPELVRNRKSRPDNWETAVIREKLLSASWPRGQVYAAVAESKGRQAFRTIVPMYYSASCLQCHGSPKGEADVTGYPKEGASEGALGGLISITLYR